MLYRNDLQHALFARDGTPEVKVRLKLRHVADAIRKVFVKFAGRHNQNAASEHFL